MLIAVAGDHAGFELKNFIVQDLKNQDIDVDDLGAHDFQPLDDYPDFASLVAEAMIGKKANRGILICGSGVGVCVAVNKYPGLRGGVCHDTYSAGQGVEHDDMNVLCLGARIIGQSLAQQIVKSFIDAKFTAEERHGRRLGKVLEIEARNLRKI